MSFESSCITESRKLIVEQFREKFLASALLDAISDLSIREIAFLLEAKGANPNYILQEYGLAPLHFAVGAGEEDFALIAVNLCLQFNGNPNIKDSDGSTPLMIAAVWGRFSIVQQLLSAEADPSIQDNDGYSALDYALEKGHLKIANALKHYCNTSVSSYSIPDHELNVCSSWCSKSSQSDSSKDIYKSLDQFSSSYLSSEYVDTEPINCICHGEDTKNKLSLKVSKMSSVLSKLSVHTNLFTEESEDELHFSQSEQRLNTGFLGIAPSIESLFSDIDAGSSCSIIKCPSHSVPSIRQSVYELLNQAIPSYRPKRSWSDPSLDLLRKLHNDVKCIRFVNSINHQSCPNLVFKSEVDNLTSQLKQISFKSSKESLSSKTTGSLTSVPESYDTDYLQFQLKQAQLFQGPVTKTTKKVYLRRLKTTLREQGLYQSPKTKTETFQVCSVLSSTLTSRGKQLLDKWSALEDAMVRDFSSSKRMLRGGSSCTAKSFFNYLLMDPSITKNLARDAPDLNDLEVWKRFLQSIFYIGKGKNSRPYFHFQEAIRPKANKPLSKKVQRIRSIWNRGDGVICLHVFHSITSVEAFTREAAMIEVLERHLTNAQFGEYHGVVATWNMKTKCQLGAVLLYRAMKVYLAEGERQIHPFDLDSPHTYRA